jgi:hypothetical protein
MHTQTRDPRTERAALAELANTAPLASRPTVGRTFHMPAPVRGQAPKPANAAQSARA